MERRSDIQLLGAADGVVAAACGPWKLLCNAQRTEALAWFPQILEYGSLQILKEYKRSYRGTTLLIRCAGERLVLKHSRRERAILSKRVLSLVKESEALAALRGALRLHRAGVSEVFRPVLALERRRRGMIEESILVYEHVEGRHVSPEDEASLREIVDTLGKCHGHGAVHADAKLENFLLSDGGIVMIDSRFKRNWLGRFGAAIDLVTLERTARAARRFIQPEDRAFVYLLARAYYAARRNWLMRRMNHALRGARARRFESFDERA